MVVYADKGGSHSNVRTFVCGSGFLGIKRKKASNADPALARFLAFQKVEIPQKETPREENTRKEENESISAETGARDISAETENVAAAAPKEQVASETTFEANRRI